MNEDSVTMEEPGLENEGAVMKGERYMKSIVASCNSCCIVVKFV